MKTHYHNHVSQKAKLMGLKLLPTLGTHYLLVPAGIVYSCFQKCLYKGSLYEVDTFLDDYQSVDSRMSA